MNCNIFTENLNKFIEEDLEDNLKLQMEEHMMQCEACRHIYDEELLMEKAFAEALSVEDIKFNSQKEKIMSKIDKNKYKNYKPKALNERLLGYIKMGAPIAAAILFVMLINPISRFRVIDSGSAMKKEGWNGVSVENKDTNIQSTSMQEKETKTTYHKKDANIAIKEGITNDKEGTLNKDSNSTNTVNTTKEANTMGNTNNEEFNNKSSKASNVNEEDNYRIAVLEMQDGTKAEEQYDNVNLETSFSTIQGDNSIQSITFEKRIVLNDNKNKDLVANKTFNSVIKSPHNDLAASIGEKKASYIQEIYVEDTNNKTLWALKGNSQDREVFIRFIKWADKENLFVIIDEVRDNSIIAEELYLLNVNNGGAIEVYKVIDNNIRIEDVNIINNVDIELKLSGAQNDNEEKIYMEGYMISNFPNTQDN